MTTCGTLSAWISYIDFGIKGSNYITGLMMLGLKTALCHRLFFLALLSLNLLRLHVPVMNTTLSHTFSCCDNPMS